MTIDEHLLAAQNHLKAVGDELRTACGEIDAVTEIVLRPILQTVNETHDKLDELRDARARAFAPNIQNQQAGA